MPRPLRTQQLLRIQQVLLDTAKTRGRGVIFFVGAAALLLLIPIGLYFWFIHQYGVNAIYYDQWNDVALLTHTRYFLESYSGHTTIGMLWAQHNESRTFFPNLIVLALGALTQLNILTELYLSAVLHLIALVLIILAHRRDVASTRLVFYLPVAYFLDAHPRPSRKHLVRLRNVLVSGHRNPGRNNLSPKSTKA